MWLKSRRERFSPGTIWRVGHGCKAGKSSRWFTSSLPRSRTQTFSFVSSRPLQYPPLPFHFRTLGRGRLVELGGGWREKAEAVVISLLAVHPGPRLMVGIRWWRMAGRQVVYTACPSTLWVVPLTATDVGTRLRRFLSSRALTITNDPFAVLVCWRVSQLP